MNVIKAKPKFAIRTVRGGTVLLYGRVYYPDPRFQEYDGRLDGQAFAFGLYYSGEQRIPLAYLWGTEAAYKSLNPDEFGPEVVDGKLPWAWWRPREEWAKQGYKVGD